MGRSVMADRTERTACSKQAHMTYTQALAVFEKNIFCLFRITQQVENYTLHLLKIITAAEGGHGKSQLKSRKWQFQLQLTTYQFSFDDIQFTTCHLRVNSLPPTTCILLTHNYHF